MDYDDNSHNNSNKISEENESNDSSEIDEDRPTLIQINKKINKERKEENLLLMKKKRLRNNNNTDIIYDANKKKLINCFCPDLEELNKFLGNCEIREIKDESEINQLNLPKDSIFDPDQFIEKNSKKLEKKTLINIEDLTLISNNKKIEYPNYLDAIEEDYFPNPKISDKSELIKNILKNEILNAKQKKELNELIIQIKNTSIKNIIKKDKLNIVFDLDNTCILGFIVALETYQKLAKDFPNKNLKIIEFKFNGKSLFSGLIIRNGLSEFLEFTKSFCNFYINTLGCESYGKEIMKILEKNMNIKFIDFKGRDDKEKSVKEKKYLKDLNLNNTNTIIFDDKPSVWVKDNLNVILSKKFTDKDFEDYLKRYNDHKLTNFLCNYFPFYYYNAQKNDDNQIKWKEQKLYGGRQCPFYKFNINDIKNNDCYSGEYLDSSKFQFHYMKDVIKILYYLLFNYDIHIPDALKLIRYNIFYNSYFNLKFYKGEGKDILKQIIETCGGEMINEKKINYINNENIYFICRKDDYLSQKDKITKEFLIYNSAKLVTEKFVLDSFYFFTSLEKELKVSDYFFNIEKNDDDYSYY